MLLSQNIALRFEIGLHLINPNRMPLPLKGLSYSVRLEGHQLLSGVTHDLPIIEGYSEADVVVQATTDLLNGLSLLSKLRVQPRDSFSYELEAKIDIGSILPSLRIKKQGEIRLQQDVPDDVSI